MSTTTRAGVVPKEESAAPILDPLAQYRQRRVLGSHQSTQPEKGFLTVLEGRPLRYDPAHQTFPVGGVDGNILSADSSRLYYSPLTSRRLYSIPTALISNFDASEEELAAGVVDEGEKGMADGLATDSRDRIYITASEHDSILRRNPDGRVEVVARDPRIIWPDGIYATDACLLHPRPVEPPGRIQRRQGFASAALSFDPRADRLGAACGRETVRPYSLSRIVQRAMSDRHTVAVYADSDFDTWMTSFVGLRLGAAILIFGDRMPRTGSDRVFGRDNEMRGRIYPFSAKQGSLSWNAGHSYFHQ
jgi:Major royal jelly protein